MRLYDLGHVPWIQSQLIYHAMPRLGLEGIIYVAPATPYVCIGYHQDVEQDIDLDFCRAQGIPVFRREVGGGGVYLDGDQIFYQIILHKDNPLAAGDKAELYRRFLQPVADTYTALGIPAQYRPVNDVITADGRKISGTGAAEMGGYVVLIDNNGGPVLGTAATSLANSGHFQRQAVLRHFDSHPPGLVRHRLPFIFSAKGPSGIFTLLSPVTQHRGPPILRCW